MDAATASAWAGTFAMPGVLDEQGEQQQAETEGDEAHDHEAQRLEVDLPVARVERPVAVEHEVVEHRDDPGGHGGHVVVDADEVHEQRSRRRG